MTKTNPTHLLLALTLLTPPTTTTTTTTTTAHMQLHHPPPFNSTNNPHRLTPPDPYDCCCGAHANRWTSPCRGYLSLLGTEQGAPTAEWAAGSRQVWSVRGTGRRGSCQVGFLDADTGSTGEGLGEVFRVARSYEGNCPRRGGGDGPEGQEFEFVVPPDLEVGVRVFAWVWYDREQEFNMNCAAVNITPPLYGDDSDGGGRPAYASMSLSAASEYTTTASTMTTLRARTTGLLADQMASSSSVSPVQSTTRVLRPSESTSTTFITVRKTLTKFSTTTMMPLQSRTLDVATASGNSLSPSTASVSSANRQRSREGSTSTTSSESVTSLITTFTTCYEDTITETLTDMAALTSQSISTELPLSSSRMSPSLLQKHTRSTESSIEPTTTIFTTVTRTPTAISRAVLSESSTSGIADQVSSRRITNIGRLGETSTSEPSSTAGVSGVFYTSTTTTKIEIVTSMVSPAAPTSTSKSTSTSSPAAAPILFKPAVEHPSPPKTTQLQSANNCTCTCPATEPIDIETCNCFCYDPSLPNPPANSSDEIDPLVKQAIATSLNTKITNNSLPRPDDLFTHPNSIPNSKRWEEQATIATDTSSPLPSTFVPFHSRPLMLIANDGTGCVTPETTAEVKYPHPGPDVVMGDGAYPLELPRGNCSSPGFQRYHGESGEDGHV